MRVTLKLRGDLLSQGFQVHTEFFQDGQLIGEAEGSLPSNPELLKKLKQWQSSYHGLTVPARELRPHAIYVGGSIQDRKETCQQASQDLAEAFQAWLKSESFRNIGDRLREKTSSLSNAIQILLRTNDQHVRQLPWQAWDLLSRYQQAEITLSTEIAEKLSSYRQQNVDTKVRILAVLGNRDGIDVESDRQFLETFSTAADVCFLDRPSPEKLQKELSERSWDIFFFAGHSRTEGAHGFICLNDHDIISLEYLEEVLRQAITNGLEVAIFNSCDGLGLARKLEDLNIPQLIVMREPVPDAIAQKFLKHLLHLYSQQDIPLYLAVREARKKLRILEVDYPCASSLPILCQNPTTPSPTWTQLRTGGRIGGDVFAKVISSTARPKPDLPSLGAFAYRKAGFRAALISVGLTALLVGVQSLGLFEPMELNAYDHFMRLRPAEGPDQRFLLITVNEADRQYQDFLGMERRGSLADEAIAEIIRQAGDHPPRVLATSIFRDHELSGQLLTALGSINSVVMVCENGDTLAKAIGIAPPSNFPIEKVGFSDAFVDDSDQVIRRQVLAMDANEICPTRQSLAFQIATAYLEPEGQFYDGGDLLARTVSIGEVSLPKLHPNSGGYQLSIDDAKGYQLLVNYRAYPPRSVDLTTVLNGSAIAQEPQLFEDKIVMIGLAPADSTDVELTPYDSDRTSGSPGIALHAQMASQIISAVLDGRPLMQGASPPVKTLWTLMWAMVATGSFLFARTARKGAILFLTQILAFQGVYYLLFLQGIWLPYGLIMIMYLILGFSLALGFRKLRLQ